MRPLWHPTLVNGRFGDPALYVETLFEKRALLFDLGDIGALPPRKIQRVERIFISHAHIDHFVGFDQALRLLVGREKTLHLYGPPGIAARVHHKLQAYEWNLARLYRTELAFVVHELTPPDTLRSTRFRLREAFAREDLGAAGLVDGVLFHEPTLRVSAALLDHRIPCLGFALAEAAHVNVWKTRLAERGLPVGPWLRDLKRAVMQQRPDDLELRVDASQSVRLGAVRDVVTITPGQKIAYVTDVADTATNRAIIVTLAQAADTLFIEAPFAAADATLAAERAHLTTQAAGEVGRAAGVRRIEPFHFSPRYAGEETRMLAEVSQAFGGPPAD